MDERVAQYLRLDSWFFWTTVYYGETRFPWQAPSFLSGPLFILIFSLVNSSFFPLTHCLTRFCLLSLAVSCCLSQYLTVSDCLSRSLALHALSQALSVSLYLFLFPSSSRSGSISSACYEAVSRPILTFNLFAMIFSILPHR